MILSTEASFHHDHYDTEGFYTWVKGLRGCKLWICAVPKDGAKRFIGPNQDINPDDFELVYFVLEEGGVL